jgi:hypothetical protein
MKPSPESELLSQPQQAPPSTEARAVEARVYRPPAILWEQPFIALAQTSTCPIPGESECVP